MAAYYNEHDPYAAQWLRNLIAAGHIASGEVDERSVVDVRADDLRGFKQCHFFAGIGVWSHALRLAGWPDDREVWTGSCPCQPFSAAGKRGGTEDERHLWPEFFRLISIARPRTVFGEQVASKDGLAWLDIVSADMEGAGYAIGALDTCAAGFGAPHIRQRLYFAADSDQGRSGRRAGTVPRTQEEAERSVRRIADGPEPGRATRSLADPQHAERRQEHGPEQDERDGQDTGRAEAHGQLGACGEVRSLADANGRNTSAEGLQRSREHGQQQEDGSFGRRLGDTEQPGLQEQRSERGTSREAVCGDSRETAFRTSTPVASTQATACVSDGKTRAQPWAVNGFWRDADWLPCIDGKARPVEPGTFPLAHGASARVGRLRAYGNSINARQAQEFISAYLK